MHPNICELICELIWVRHLKRVRKCPAQLCRHANALSTYHDSEQHTIRAQPSPMASAIAA
jgi:hypothetical protein